jgi:hypothetical protein
MNDYWGNTRLQKFSSYQEHSLHGIKIFIGVGSLGISGGTNLIFNYAEGLRKSGAQVAIGFLIGNTTDAIWHSSWKNFEIKPINEFEGRHFDLGVATWWPTVEATLKLSCSRYLYFVQSLESRFALNYTEQGDKYRAAATYMLGLPTVTVASWLNNLLQSQTPSKTWLIRNGIDKGLFPRSFPSRGTTGKLRVLAEGPLNVPMKAVEETLETLSNISEVEVWHVNPALGKSSNSDRTFNSVPIFEMHKLYSEVDVLVKMSRVEGMFGPPLEAFHCGATAIVSRVTGHDEYIIHGVNSILVDVDDFDQLALEVQALRDDRDLVISLKEGAKKIADSWPEITTSQREFVSVCYFILTSNNLGVVNRKNTLEQLENLRRNTNEISRELLLE